MMHTKGPWKVDRLRSIYQESDAESQDRIAEAFVMAKREKNINNPSLVIQAQANAHLIAAAPELLEALQNLVDRDLIKDTEGDHYTDATEAIRKVDAA